MSTLFSSLMASEKSCKMNYPSRCPLSQEPHEADEAKVEAPESNLKPHLIWKLHLYPVVKVWIKWNGLLFFFQTIPKDVSFSSWYDSVVSKVACGLNADASCPWLKLQYVSMSHLSWIVIEQKKTSLQKEWFSGLESLRPVILNTDSKLNSLSDIYVYLSDMYWRLGNLLQQQKYICSD